MSKSILGTILAIVAILLVVGVIMANQKDDEPTIQQTPSSTNQTDTESTNNNGAVNEEATEAKTVNIQNSAFSPGKITVKKGTTVTWTNKDALQHTVTPDDETAEFKSSGNLSRNESYSVTFNTAGTYTYHCELHPDMTGTVTVTE